MPKFDDIYQRVFAKAKKRVMDLENKGVLKGIISSTVDGIISISHRGIMQFVNDSAKRLFGYSEEEMIGNSINMLLPPEVLPAHHDKYIANYLSSGHANIIGIGREVKGKRKDGSTFPFWLSVSESHANGKVIFTGFIHDLSDQKKTEHALKELTRELEAKVTLRTHELANAVDRLLKFNVQLAKEVKEKEIKEIALRNSEEELRFALEKEKDLNEMKSRFLTMASHEFKTPLSAILSSASILSRYTESDQQEHRTRHILKIKKMIRQLNDILNDFLSAERMDGNDIPINLSTFDLEEFIVGIVDEMDAVLKKNQAIEVQYLIPEKEIFQDANILRIILRNLLSNSIKYSKKGQIIELVVYSKDDQYVLKVKDNGIGIPQAEQPYVFTRFYRSTNASNIQGTGLGLAIVERYVHVLSGKITFESKEGEGTTFEVNIPKKNGKEKENISD